jgi:prepilin-type N-terminal cleavage/methylation domain-containing protein
VIKEKRVHKQMGPRGFTIVETLIVLAVSGVLFVSIATVIAGRQRATEFSQSVQDIKSQVQSFINEVSTGIYQNGGTDFSCTTTSGTLTITVPPATNTGQGANQGCILVGKILHFTSGADPQGYYGYSIAGKQIDSTGAPVDTIDSAAPKVLADGTDNSALGTPAASAAHFSNEIQNFRLQYGLRIAYICYNNCIPAAVPLSPVQQTGSLAFISLGGSAATGSQAVNFLPIGGSSSLGNTTAQEAAAITQFFSSNTLSTLINPPSGAYICFVGGGGKSALMNIGASGSALSVTVDIKDNPQCT